jgi:hypothetical protein
MDWEDQVGAPLIINHLIVDSSIDPQFTGIFDDKGTPIFRFPIPIGFGRDFEW